MEIRSSYLHNEISCNFFILNQGPGSLHVRVTTPLLPLESKIMQHSPSDTCTALSAGKLLSKELRRLWRSRWLLWLTQSHVVHLLFVVNRRHRCFIYTCLPRMPGNTTALCIVRLAMNRYFPKYYTSNNLVKIPKLFMYQFRWKYQ